MKTLQLIVECNMDEEKEAMINKLGKVKYRLPMINAYVLEIPESALSDLEGLEIIEAVYETSHITAQMNTARKAVKADIAQKNGYSGRGISIAVLDTGVAPVDDLIMPRNRLVAFKDIVNGKKDSYDDNGHGTHVAGIAAGNGILSGGKYMGIAPESNIVAVKVLDGEGRGNSADVLAGIQWVLDNKDLYNIRVMNLSVGTHDNGDKDPLVKAVESAWDNGIVVIVAAGNNGPRESTITSPGVSRKVITVGASDDNKTVQIWGDSLVNFSGRGPTLQCIKKPDVIAPGADIISCLTTTPNKDRLKNNNLKIIAQYYLQMSGTSMSTPVISGAVALLLQKYPKLKPNDVKLMLKKAAVNMYYPQNQQGWGILDIEKLLSEEAIYV